MPRRSWTSEQARVFASEARLTVWWGANGIGKTTALAEVARRALGGELPWQRQGEPYTVLVVGRTWTQLGTLLRHLWDTVDRSWFRDVIRFEGGALRGQKLAVYEVVGGPCAGGELRCGVHRAEGLAAPRSDVVVSDEPLPEDVHAELWARLLGRDGRMYVGFTPTLGTYADLRYLWALVDDPGIPWAQEIRTELTLDAATPRDGLIEVPWITQREIDEHVAGLSALERDMRLGRSREARVDTAYFSAWGPHLVSDERPPDGTPVGVGIDHGSKPGAQRAVLSAVGGGHGLDARVWTLDEYRGEGRTDEDQDAAGLLEMLGRQQLTVADVDVWVGDRAHRGDRRGGEKSNDRLKAALAKRLGYDTTRRGWSSQLPEPLRNMRTPRKYHRSLYEGVDILHRTMLGARPRLHVATRCTALVGDIVHWQGGTTDPAKDGIDAWRYAVVPMLEGTRR